ncbi:uncharacterized protein FOMMEDRAFT_141645 [Fomitiporia mediterranea MF3/22]|uniref:uncharacterized protein n=1 Tax=Fomitiporia mediterranea (strain MF3/22) TaxID=694068 RepID=UPI0004408856|nr:uncharacterized protein FOMMEDRAFT_141645 [Fomitiporia mediterranea MF3/22]EJD00867.1 hypothetical protein FOMMEDRAFT_141645 [Fomitiporia mediterranea MF3/22]
MNNSLNPSQSPCLVASYLGSPCSPGDYDVPKIKPGGYYLTVDAEVAQKCRCSWAEYNALQACAICQNGTARTWDSYSLNCTDFISDTYYPLEVAIPPETAIPVWVTTYPASWSGGIFNATEAHGLKNEGHGDITQENRNSQSHDTKKSNTGATVGAVVGGVALCLIVVGMWYFFVRRKRLRSAKGIWVAHTEQLDPILEVDTTITPFPAPTSELPPRGARSITGKHRRNVEEAGSSTHGLMLSNIEMSSAHSSDISGFTEDSSQATQTTHQDLPPPTYTSVVSPRYK